MIGWLDQERRGFDRALCCMVCGNLYQMAAKPTGFTGVRNFLQAMTKRHPGFKPVVENVEAPQQTLNELRRVRLRFVHPRSASAAHLLLRHAHITRGWNAVRFGSVRFGDIKC